MSASNHKALIMVLQETLAALLTKGAPQTPRQRPSRRRDTQRTVTVTNNGAEVSLRPSRNGRQSDKGRGSGTTRQRSCPPSTMSAQANAPAARPPADRPCTLNARHWGHTASACWSSTTDQSSVRQGGRRHSSATPAPRPTRSAPATPAAAPEAPVVTPVLRPAASTDMQAAAAVAATCQPSPGDRPCTLNERHAGHKASECRSRVASGSAVRTPSVDSDTAAELASVSEAPVQGPIGSSSVSSGDAVNQPTCIPAPAVTQTHRATPLAARARPAAPALVLANRNSSMHPPASRPSVVEQRLQALEANSLELRTQLEQALLLGKQGRKNLHDLQTAAAHSYHELSAELRALKEKSRAQERSAERKFFLVSDELLKTKARLAVLERSTESGLRQPQPKAANQRGAPPKSVDRTEFPAPVAVPAARDAPSNAMPTSTQPSPAALPVRTPVDSAPAARMPRPADADAPTATVLTAPSAQAPASATASVDPPASAAATQDPGKVLTAEASTELSTARASAAAAQAKRQAQAATAAAARAASALVDKESSATKSATVVAQSADTDPNAWMQRDAPQARLADVRSPTPTLSRSSGGAVIEQAMRGLRRMGGALSSILPNSPPSTRLPGNGGEDGDVTGVDGQSHFASATSSPQGDEAADDALPSTLSAATTQLAALQMTGPGQSRVVKVRRAKGTPLGVASTPLAPASHNEATKVSTPTPP